MSAPVVSSVAQEVYDSLPPAWTAQDADNGYVLLLLCDAMTTLGMQPLADYGLDRPDGTPGWASLFDAAKMTGRTARYLGQFVGVEVPAGLTDRAARDLLSSHPNYGRGRPSTIVAAIKATLSGSQRVDLQERDTSAYHATIVIYQSQVVDLDRTLAAIARVKPAGDMFTVLVKSGPTYGAIRQSLPQNNYGSRKSTYPTYGDVQEFSI